MNMLGFDTWLLGVSLTVEHGNQLATGLVDIGNNQIAQLTLFIQKNVQLIADSFRACLPKQVADLCAVSLCHTYTENLQGLRAYQ